MSHRHHKPGNPAYIFSQPTEPEKEAYWKAREEYIASHPELTAGQINQISCDPTIYSPDQVDQIAIGMDLFVRKSEYIKLGNQAVASADQRG